MSNTDEANAARRANCRKCGGTGRLPRLHFSDYGRCWACLPQLPPVVVPGPDDDDVRELMQAQRRQMRRTWRSARRR